MSEMEEKLGAILNNPQIMQNILSMAQSLNQSTTQTAQQEPPAAGSLPAFDPSMLQQLGGLAAQTGIDREQQALLRALSPYLTNSRVHKLEKAMRAAKMARLASTFLNSGGAQILTGR